jgi:hypothetical protein
VRAKFLIRAAVLAVFTLGVLVFGSSAAMGHGKQKPLKIVAQENQSNFVDVAPAGESVGDQLVFSEVLYRRGREVGDSGVVCTVTEVVAYNGEMLHCVATLSLRRGQITLQGLIEVQGEDDPGPWTVAITGGTGAYRGASGEARVRDRPDGRTVYKLKFDKKKKHNHKH